MSFLTSLLLLLLLICLSMHACHGRHLPVVNKASGGQIRHFVEGVKKETFNENLIQSEVKTSLQATNQNSKVDEGLGGANTSIQKAEEVKETKKSDVEGVAQEESLLVSVSWLIPPKKRGGWQASAVSALGSESYVNEEGNIDSKGSVEDVVIMDYESPHQKPPIHNLSP